MMTPFGGNMQGCIREMAAENEASVVASRIRQMRSDLKLTQTAFAKELGASRSYVSDVENGNARVTIDLLFQIVETFGTRNAQASMTWLLTGSHQPVPWGDNPSLSRLNVVLALEQRGLAAALEAIDTIERAEGAQFRPDIKARLLRQALYIYTSEFERLIQQDTAIEDARQLAALACRRVTDGFTTDQLAPTHAPE